MLPSPTLYELVKQHARTSPDAPALYAVGREALNYGRLVERVESLIGQLQARGIRQESGELAPLAMVLPNGPEMVVAFLAAASLTASAPLNPGYRRAEFDFYLGDLRPQALLTLAGMDTPARRAAQDLGISILELAEGFTLAGEPCGFDPDRQSRAHDVALVLHTSGTTARPKLVPLTHTNLVSSALSIGSWLRLGRQDCCLNIMPLFHIHGLAAAVLATLASQASLVATPGFDASKFFEWMAAFRPTWYTAVPAMHQAILQRAPAHRDLIRESSLRFVRSCSSPLPPQVTAELEKVFGIPAVEAYGMTEAAHQISCNPLLPGARKPGSVGLASGPQVAIMAEEGVELLPAFARGEVVVRGVNVTPGYHGNPEANQRSFVNTATHPPWFRTGDQGYLDDAGYLFITGRLKELINRGGEKIAPREIDEALLDHPDVAQAVAFAMPDPQLGEEVAAAVVLRPTASEITPLALRQFASLRLAQFKVPRRIVVVDEIPKGPTGKPQRIGLAERLAEAVAAQGDGLTAGPESELEQRIAHRLDSLWCSVLGVPHVGLDQTFQAAGGDSLLAAKLMSVVEDTFARPEWGWDPIQERQPLTLLELFEAQTIDAQAKVIAQWLSRF